MPLRLSPLLIVIGLLTAQAPGAMSAPVSPHRSPSSPPALDETLPLALSRQMRPAIVALRESLTLNPRQPELLVQLGEAFERIGDVERAMAAYRQALDLRPDHALSYYRFWTARRTYVARTDPAVLDRHADRASPTLSPIGRQLVAPGERHEYGGAASDRGIPGPWLLVPRDPEEGRIRLGLILAGQGRIEAAVEEYLAALATNPDNAAARLHLGQALMLQRRWHEARLQLEEAVGLDPNLAPAHYTLGMVRYTLDDLTGSVQAYRRALEADPTFTEARFQLGMLLHVLGRERQGVAHLLVAAGQGLPQAQFFVGSAFASGRGVAADAARALRWWFDAAAGGSAEARDAIVRLRRAAQDGPDAPSAREAFGRYRASLWEARPEIDPLREGELLGERLLSMGRIREALPVLMREAEALSEEAHRLLEALYEVGVQGVLPPHDPGLLSFFRTAADDGVARSRLVLGRLYHHGLGVASDAGLAARWFSEHLATQPARLEDRSFDHGPGPRDRLEGELLGFGGMRSTTESAGPPLRVNR